MLSLRCALRNDGQPAPSELVYGIPLTLRADLLVPSTEYITHNAMDYSHLLKCYMHRRLGGPITTTHNVSANPHSYIDHSLQTHEKVLICNEAKKGLQPNYKGPLKVRNRDAKFFSVELANGTPDNVSIDRLKACYTWEQALPKPQLPAQLVSTEPGLSTAPTADIVPPSTVPHCCC